MDHLTPGHAQTGENRGYPHPSDAPAEEYSQEDVQAAWNDGYEAAKEEFHMDDSPQGRSLRIKRKMLGIIGVSVNYDIPLTSEDVKASWDDAFLTNVMVPYLEHIKEENRGRQAQILSRISRQTQPASPEQTERFKSLLKDTNALDQVIHILKEWRG